MKVVIIGAGVQGITTAYHLNNSGQDVLVLDKMASAGDDTSFGNGGMLHATLPAPWNEPDSYKLMLKSFLGGDVAIRFHLKQLLPLASWGLKFLSYSNFDTFIKNTKKNIQLAQYSLTELDNIVSETGINLNENKAGLLKIFRDEKSQQGLAQFADLFVEDGAKYQQLSTEQVFELEPSLVAGGQDIVGGMLLPQDRSADCHQFCKNLYQYTQNNGVAYQFNSEVTQITKSQGQFIITVNGQENIIADKVVVAAACFSPSLVKDLGLKIPVKPAKGYSFSLPMAGWQNKAQIAMIDTKYQVGCTPLGQQLRFGGIAEFAGFNKQIDKSVEQKLLSSVNHMFPDFYQNIDKNELNTWTGLRPVSVDGVPVLGKTHVENLYLNTGHGSLGWTMAAGSAKHVADIVLEKETLLNEDEFELGRFS